MIEKFFLFLSLDEEEMVPITKKIFWGIVTTIIAIISPFVGGAFYIFLILFYKNRGGVKEAVEFVKISTAFLVEIILIYLFLLFGAAL
jgi:hypothetical protein